MSRSSRSKSHKQSKHSSRDYSDLNEDAKMKEKSDRWNDDGEDESEVVNIDDIDWESNDLLKAVGDLKSKSSRKHDGDKESGRKKVHRDHSEWSVEEELRNIELEKELKKRMKRRENYGDVKDGDGRMSSSKRSRDKDDTKPKDDKDREKSGQVSKSRGVKNRVESEKDNKHREDGNRYKKERHQEDVDHDHRHKNERPRDDKDREKRARDPDRRDAKKLKYDSDYDRQTNKGGGSPVFDDRVSRHKDNKDRKRDNNNNDEIADYRSREAEKRSSSGAKINLASERGRSSSRDEMEITSNHMRHRSSSSTKLYPSRDHHRVSKQEETKNRDHVREDRACRDFSAPRESDKISSHSLEKTTQKDENRVNDLSAEKRLKSDSRSSPSSTSKISSFLPPQSPFKTVLDSPLINCNQGSGDPNMGRAQTNWNNWASSPLANSGYTPFHHVPSSLFNPVMQQFPMFGGLPMNMNHAGFFSHGLHGWESSNGGFGNWDHGRARFNNHMWNDQGLGVQVDVKSVAEKNDDLVHGPTDEISTGQMGPHMDKEQIQLDFKTPEVMKVKESSPVSMVKKDDDNFIYRSYLSKIDVSEDLTRPELYEQCRRMLGLDQASASEDFDCRILYLEVGVDADSSNDGSLFAATDDSVFKKALSLYAKQKVHFSVTDEGIGSVSYQDQEKSYPVVDVKLAEKALEGPVLAVSQEHEGAPVKIVDMNHTNEEDMEVDHLVVNQEKESSAPSVGGCEVKVNELDKPSAGGSLSVLNSELTTKLSECGSVNSSHIPPKSTH